MNENLARKVFNIMYNKDFFSQWLGIEPIIIEEGYCKLKMTVRDEMLNGFAIAHGGISYSLADSALAFAANSYGIMGVTLDSYTSYPSSAKSGDILYAEAKKISLTKRTAFFDVVVKNQDEKDILYFRGTVFRTEKQFFEDEDENNN